MFVNQQNQAQIKKKLIQPRKLAVLRGQRDENVAAPTKRTTSFVRKRAALDDVSNISKIPVGTLKHAQTNDLEAVSLKKAPLKENIDKIEKVGKIEQNFSFSQHASDEKLFVFKSGAPNFRIRHVEPKPVVTKPYQIHDAEIDKKRAKKPRTQDWQDLDADDVHDPLMVSEYAVDIFQYLKELEAETAPRPDYMDQQNDLSWKMREILVDWLIEVHNKFRLLPETLFLAINIIDRFLSVRVVSLVKLQLVGITGLFVAAKYEEVIAPSIKNFIYMVNNGYTDDEILKAERYILQTIDFKMNYPNPMNFLRRASKADNFDIQSRTVAKYLMEISLVDHNFLPYPPSMIAAAALCLSRKMLHRSEWNANLIHYSTFTEKELEPCIRLMLNYLSKPTKHEQLFKKYSTKKFMKASVFVQDWVEKYLQRVKWNSR
ncbi:1205_t:CDS:2 [Gigaspora margarita]|uniref:1205_t:CDS:1 n=2 Tax=Gigaspora margarita TaxID=4874 RepID=A0ABN7VZV2_GIGMA|nr:A/B/D/E cyclin [Gigaspora margarita]CAG8808360.1 1205_t:CDS:2 [Gigaspora margarita]